ncbi:aminotransferase class I/II-fold pyridoxal phosphate-dependent enzyme [Pseudonocardia sp. GCM10023141]|uniref:aminotransferase class I/II-fold pyridoxal phosphate-dependent enzyme n=1 Tax=Pseudonocardia sp. GCM10023141 TaxID=3252653 RepID=UPI0036120C4F
MRSNAHHPDELAAVVELATRYGVAIVSDEIHAPLTLPGATFTPLLTVPGAAEIAVAVHSTSKAWNLAGLRCAALVAGAPSMHAVLDGLPPDTRGRVGHLGALATVAAYTGGGGWLDALLVELRRALLARGDPARAAARDRLAPAGGHVPAWLDCRAVDTLGDVQERFLRDGRVAVEPGTRFGADTGGWVRLTFGTSSEILDEALRRMAAALGS